MLKKIFFGMLLILAAEKVQAKAVDYAAYFNVDMKAEIPDVKEYAERLNSTHKLYDRGYISRFNMGNKFKKEFSRTIKFYGLSEGRIKSNYEDELLEILSWIPKEAYQYIGPALHEVPGMSPKILNLPGIKETKNQFPKDIAERFKGVEGLEFMSPALYFLLMPEIWDEKKPEDLDKPTPKKVKKPRINTELPDFLKEQIGEPVKTAEKQPASAQKKVKTTAQQLGLRTIKPTLSSPLTVKDVKAFASTIDSIMEWGTGNNMSVFSKLIQGEALLDIWEHERGTALPQNELKDAVNPCQRLVLKVRFADLYPEFMHIVAKQGFTPEEWAYTCDKTIKAFRVAQSDINTAYAVRFHRRGYYDKYIESLPQKWHAGMYAAEEAIIKMYTVFRNDIDAVEPYMDELRQKFTKMGGIMLTAPIIY